MIGTMTKTIVPFGERTGYCVMSLNRPRGWTVEVVETVTNKSFKQSGSRIILNHRQREFDQYRRRAQR
jgi:hypothetical protein